MGEEDRADPGAPLALLILCVLGVAWVFARARDAWEGVWHGHTES